jgi:hypothetical protein
MKEILQWLGASATYPRWALAILCLGAISMIGAAMALLYISIIGREKH